MVEKGKERTEKRKFEIQKNRLTISAFFQIHQKTENRDKEPCYDLALARRRWLRTVMLIITSEVKGSFNKRVEENKKPKGYKC